MTVHVRVLYDRSMKIDQVIQSVKQYYFSQRRLPSIQELSDQLRISKRAGAKWANKLVEEGFLGKDEKGKLFPKRLFEIPKLGLIHAGFPSAGDALQDESIDLYSYLLDKPGSVFSLVVKGDSMIDEGIHDGDVVLIQKGKEAKNRDIVAAYVDGDWTLKQFVIQDNEILLVPANAKYPVIRPKHSLQLGGVVISVLRNYY